MQYAAVFLVGKLDRASQLVFMRGVQPARYVGKLDPRESPGWLGDPVAFDADGECFEGHPHLAEDLHHVRSAATAQRNQQELYRGRRGDPVAVQHHRRTIIPSAFELESRAEPAETDLHVRHQVATGSDPVSSASFWRA